MTDPRPTRGPFAGLRVLEVAEGMAGPMVGMTLADYGADVVKVEPPAGDWARQFPGWLMWNRGKRSVAADLHQPSGVDVVAGLISDADVVISALGAGSTGGVALGCLLDGAPETLVRCHLTTSGRYRIPGLPDDMAAYEHVVAAAMGRMQGLDQLSGGGVTGVAEGRPAYTMAPVGAYGAAQLATQSVLGALWRRNRTGEGAVITTSLLQGMSAAVMRFPFRREAGSDAVLPRDHSANLQVKGIALTFMTAECSDGRYIQMCARQDHHFRNWLKVLDLAHLLDEPRFAHAPMGLSSEADIENLEKLLREGMRQRTQAEWMDIFIHDSDIGADPFLTSAEFLRHPQLEANDRLIMVDDPVNGSVRQLGPLAMMRGVALPAPTAAPALPAPGVAVAWHPRPARGAVRSISVARSTPAALPFAGVTVVELAYYLAAPLGATLLAELGARVIKIEPPQGDSYRRAGVEFIHMVHGKESIALNLRTPEARAILHRLLGEADALLTNFRPGVPERLGFGYDEVHALNPRLVYLYAASYGSRGEQSHRAAFHSTPNALAGGGIRQAGEGNAPVDDSYPDPVSGLAVGTALSIGLLARDASGEGCYLESSMLVSTGYSLSNDLVGCPGGSTPMVDGGQHGLGPLYRLYECDGDWMFLGICQEHEWHALAGVLSDGALPTSDYAWPAVRTDDLASILAELFRCKPAAEWVPLLAAAGVPAVVADGAGLEMMLQRVGFLTAASHPSVGPYWRLDPRMEIEGVSPDRRPATGLGEFTVPLLAEFGYSRDEIDDFVDRGIVAVGPIINH